MKIFDIFYKNGLKLILLPVLFLTFAPLKGQITWNNVYNTPLPESDYMGQVEGNEIIWRDDHIMLFSDGNSCYGCINSSAIFFRKLDHEGNLLDMSVFHDTLNFVGYRLDGHLRTSDLIIENQIGSITIMAQQLNYTDTGTSTIGSIENVMMHLDEDFEVLDFDTLQSLNPLSNDYFIIETITERESGYLVGGMFNNPDHFHDETGFMAELNKETGDTLWLKMYDSFEAMTDIVLLQNDELYVSGRRPPFISEPSDVGLLRCDNEGEVIDTFRFGGPSAESSSDIILDNDKLIIGAIYSVEPSEENDYEFYYGFRSVIESDDGFEVTDSATYGVSQNFNLDIGAFKDPNEEGYYIFGSYNEPGLYLRSGILLKVDQNLDSLWSRRYRHFDSVDSDHHLQYMTPLPDGGFLGSGYIEQGVGEPNYGDRTLWAFRADEYGCIEPGCQDVNVEEITLGLESVMSVYPNPTKNNVTIQFDLPSNFTPVQQSQLRLMTTDGREVLRKNIDSNTFVSPIQLNLKSLKPGVYIVHWIENERWFDSVRVVVE